MILLETAGIKSVPDLAAMDPPALAKKMASLNKCAPHRQPGAQRSAGRGWVSQASKLPAVLVRR